MSSEDVFPRPAAGGYVGRCLRIFSCVLEHEHVTPRQICEATGYGRTVVHRSIHTLIEQGFVRYELGRHHVVPSGQFIGNVLRHDARNPYVEAICDRITRLRRGWRSRSMWQH